MQYMLLISGDEARMEAASEADTSRTVAAYAAYSEAMREAGIMRGGNRLRPTAAATTVRVRDGKTEVLNGPYAETREQLGGYFLIEVPDLDAALTWAARCPGAAYGSIEVRPIWTM
ncbi:MAG TPA: YciI family protein [Acetobacteraceae bacterium]|nr:YciI family protein [Acetobacteraceae bacterium]